MIKKENNDTSTKEAHFKNKEARRCACKQRWQQNLDPFKENLKPFPEIPDGVLAPRLTLN